MGGGGLHKLSFTQFDSVNPFCGEALGVLKDNYSVRLEEPFLFFFFLWAVHVSNITYEALTKLVPLSVILWQQIS